MSVPVFVTDRKGRRATGLSAADFSVTDNGKPREIAFFGAKERPVDILFALDDSGSIRDVIAQQQMAALGMMDHFAQARMGILRFGREARLTVPFGTDTEILRREFYRPSSGETHTAIFDAAMASVRTLVALNPSSTERRGIVILISDGLDTASTIKPAAVIDAARQAGISFYVIQLPLYTVRGNSLVMRPVAKGFKELASQTGGLYLAGAKEDAVLATSPAIDLAPLFRSIAEDVNGRYELAYYLDPPADRPGPHHLEVKCVSSKRKELEVRVMRSDFILDADGKPRAASTAP